MVTTGFIVEGDSESILIKDESFINFLSSMNISISKDLVINAGGKYTLYHPGSDFTKLESRVNGWINILKSKGAQVIFFILDFDNSDVCFTQFKSKTFHYAENYVVIAKQALEAWFLADHQTLSIYLDKQLNIIPDPESNLIPFEQIKALRLLHTGRGVSDKKILTRHMINAGFSIIGAASHPNCPSASYFLKKLQSLNTP